ncbi:fatty acid desaturase [Corynascus novoguineensis]|uniref:Fatty acid desaturase n=1 Tax=Corynascus novoguineensis TaxID=1126955 RepID=A0AAN7CWN1_9PEZI|nr:fatty acid desaturase [Corynascus novoguineensis]
MGEIIFDPNLTVPDALVLRNLADDIQRHEEIKRDSTNIDRDEGYSSTGSAAKETVTKDGVSAERDAEDLKKLTALNDPTRDEFEPTVITSLDLSDLRARLPKFVFERVVLPYVAWAQTVVRHETDVVMVTHLLLYLTTSLPSAAWLLFYRFSYLHGVLHFAMQVWYMGSYTLMMHQHIHQRGVLSRRSWLLRLVDALFPYVTDPLMGHTWNSYYYHHIKHHHVEGNGPDDLSSTLRFQRDSALDFLRYVGRFLALVWLDLPLYYVRKGRPGLGARAAFWELGNYAAIYGLSCLRGGGAPVFFVLLGPLLLMRLGLMVGNWGQHALVDPDEPDSDFRSSITLVDVPSNRHCYNDGYHTSHHLNPRRHWRDHPVAFLRQKETYAAQRAIVLHDIDYLGLTARLLLGDYSYLARKLVPLGAEQMDMSLAEREALLRRCTRKFSEDEIRAKFGRGGREKEA